jgi:hypothetical protein
VKERACIVHNLVANRAHSDARLFQNFECVRPNLASAQRIARGFPSGVDPDGHPGFAGASIALVGSWFDDIDRSGNKPRAQGKSHTRCQPAAAAGYDHGIRDGTACLNGGCNLRTQRIASCDHFHVFESVQIAPSAFPRFHLRMVSQL